MPDEAQKTDASSAEIRAWLRENRQDLAVGTRGKLSKQAVDAYRAGAVEGQPQR